MKKRISRKKNAQRSNYLLYIICIGYVCLFFAFLYFPLYTIVTYSKETFFHNEHDKNYENLDVYLFGYIYEHWNLSLLYTISSCLLIPLINTLQLSPLYKRFFRFIAPFNLLFIITDFAWPILKEYVKYFFGINSLGVSSATLANNNEKYLKMRSGFFILLAIYSIYLAYTSWEFFAKSFPLKKVRKRVTKKRKTKSKKISR